MVRLKQRLHFIPAKNGETTAAKRHVNLAPFRHYATSTYVERQIAVSASLLPESRPVHRKIRQPHSPLEVGAVIQIVLRRALGNFERPRE
jgi:hypothetical protein